MQVGTARNFMFSLAVLSLEIEICIIATYEVLYCSSPFSTVFDQVF